MPLTAEQARRFGAAVGTHSFEEPPAGAKDLDGGGGSRSRLYSDGTIKIIGAPQSAYEAGKNPIGAVFKADSVVGAAIQAELDQLHGAAQEGESASKPEAMLSLEEEYAQAKADAPNIGESPVEVEAPPGESPDPAMADDTDIALGMMGSGPEESDQPIEHIMGSAKEKEKRDFDAGAAQGYMSKNLGLDSKRDAATKRALGKQVDLP